MNYRLKTEGKEKNTMVDERDDRQIVQQCERLIHFKERKGVLRNEVSVQSDLYVVFFYIYI